MHLVIAVVVSMCANISSVDVQKKVAELQKQYPTAKVTARFDKKCSVVAEE